MIVHQDDRRRPFGDRFPEHFSGMHQRGIQDSTGNGQIPIKPMLRIQHCHVKLLNGQIFQPRRKRRPDVARRPQWRSIITGLCRQAPADLQGGVNRYGARQSESVYAGQCGDGLAGETP